jgi:GntR family transcriptional regulator
MAQHPSKLNFREIAQQVREAILAGRYPPATVMPAEPVLADQFGVSRALINRAMQLLAAEGLVRPRQGKGTLVTWIPPLVHSPARYARQTREQGRSRGAFDSEIKAIGLVPRHEITTERAEPPVEIAHALGLPPGERNCLVRRRRLSASGIPVRWNASWFSLEIAGGTVLEEPDSIIIGGVKTALADLGYPQTAATERIVTRLPSDAEIEVLEISPERTVLDIFHMGSTASNQVVEVTTTVTPAHYLILETEFPLV